MSKTSFVYLLLGPEVGEKEKYLTQIINLLKKEKGKKPEIFKFFPYDLNIIDVITLLRNGMLFSDHKVVIIENIQDLKKSDVNALIDYCIENNYMPIWSCQLANISSQKLALKLCFEENLKYPNYQLPK